MTSRTFCRGENENVVNSNDMANKDSIPFTNHSTFQTLGLKYSGCNCLDHPWSSFLK